jgi:hypothetical protein
MSGGIPCIVGGDGDPGAGAERVCASEAIDDRPTNGAATLSIMANATNFMMSSLPTAGEHDARP